MFAQIMLQCRRGRLWRTHMKDKNWMRIDVGKVVILYRSNLNSRMNRFVNVVFAMIDVNRDRRGYSNIILPPPIDTTVG